MTETLRLFFAFWPEPALRASLRRRTRDAVRRSGGRPVPAANLHLTLLFLGNQAEARLPEIMDAAASALPPPGELRLSRVGAFPRPRVLWAGPERTPLRLSTSVRRLRGALRGAGIASASRPFHAHVTLARRIGRQAEGPLPPLTWRYRELALVASETDTRGARYRTVAEWPLLPLPED